MSPGIFHSARGWEPSKAAGLMTWEAVLQKVGCTSARFSHPHRSVRNFINWCSEAEEGMFLAPATASPPAPRQTCRPASWALLNTDLHRTKLSECVFDQMCSLLLAQREFCSANFHTISTKREKPGVTKGREKDPHFSSSLNLPWNCSDTPLMLASDVLGFKNGCLFPFLKRATRCEPGCVEPKSLTPPPFLL